MKTVFLGPPGAGKGTIAQKAEKLLAIPHISTGDLFRNNVRNKTELGKIVQGIMERGELVPDEITLAMVQQRLKESDTSAGFILDGFPRTIVQAEDFAEVTDLSHVINFVCPEEELIKRLTGRRSCPNCGQVYHVLFMPPKQEGVCDSDGASLQTRSDDTLQAVQNRLKVYHESTAPLIHWYKEKNLLKNIEAAVPPDEVFESVRVLLA